MNLSEGIYAGLMGAACMSGIDLRKIDTTNHIIYLDIPRQSYEYDIPETKIKTAEQHAKRIKEMLQELYSLDVRVKYREKDIYWTKEMGDFNYKQNKRKILDDTLWDNVPVC